MQEHTIINMNLVTETNLPLHKIHSGKIRDTYDLGEHLLIVATDRISAFDFVLPSGIPYKGYVLNQISDFWFKKTVKIIQNHLIKSITDPESLNELSIHPLPRYLLGRSMIVKRAQRIPIEAVVRGYISGSAWEEYKKSGTINQIKQEKYLLESQKLDEPVFTPTTKADIGHDIPITFEELCNLIGTELATIIRNKSIEIYNFAHEYALQKDIIIADTKLEFGLINGQLFLIDELLTPDSSRFWDKNNYKPGIPQQSYDKQPLRDWLSNSGWDKNSPPPQLPEKIIHETSQRYINAYEKLTGQKLIY